MHIMEKLVWMIHGLLLLKNILFLWIFSWGVASSRISKVGMHQKKKKKKKPNPKPPKQFNSPGIEERG